MPALVAKSYENLEQVSEPYEVNGREYVKVRLKTGAIKQVRSYSEKEYKKFYPEIKIIQPARSPRDILGFGEAGFIWIFKGDTYENLGWFQNAPTRFARDWGWYLPSDIEMPSPLPAGVEPLKLTWEEVVSEDGISLKPEKEIKKYVDTLIYEPGKSEYVGNIGDRLDLVLTCVKTVPVEGYYGINTIHTFQDEDENVFVWSTSAKVLSEGTTYAVRGTVKGHDLFRNTRQTILTRCKVEEI